jgi:hypothetical protein
MLPAVGLLASKGLNLLANAAMSQGKEWIKQKTGVDLESSTLSEADFLELRKYEMDHEEELIRLAQEGKRIDQNLTQIILGDVADARKMQMAALSQDDLFSKRFAYYFISVWSVFAMVFLFCITFLEVPESNTRFADTVLGLMAGLVISGMFQFLLGSSGGSKSKDTEKDGIIHALMQKLKLEK